MFDADLMAVLGRELLRERSAELIAEACAWAVGLSDRAHYLRRRGRLTASGMSIGVRAGTGQWLSGEEDGRLELGDSRPGSFQDALNAVAADGNVYADRFDAEVLEPFVFETCVLAAGRAQRHRPEAWRELLQELGEDDGADLAAVVRAGEWDVPLRIDAEHLVLAALGHLPLMEVEAEGLPLALVRAAEAVTRAAAAPPAAAPDEEALAGALFLADAAVRAACLPVPVPIALAEQLLAALLDQGLEPEEIRLVLPRLRVPTATVARVSVLLDAARPDG